MAANDVYSADFYFETPSGRATSRIFYRETNANVTAFPNTDDLAESIRGALTASLLALLSNDYWFTSVCVRKVHPTVTRTALEAPFNTYQAAREPSAHKTVDGPGQVGAQSGPGLPANNAIQLDLQQSTFSLQSNGKLYIPGIPELQTAGPTLGAGYVTTVQTFADLLAQPRTSFAADTGVWEPVVVSAKIRDVLGPGQPKDWITSIAPIDSIEVNPIIALRKSRTTPVSGGAR